MTNTPLQFVARRETKTTWPSLLGMTDSSDFYGRECDTPSERTRGLVDVQAEVARRLSVELRERMSSRDRIVAFRAERDRQLHALIEQARSQREEVERALSMLELTRRLNGRRAHPSEAYLLDRRVSLRRELHSLLLEQRAFEVECVRRLQALEEVIVQLKLDLGSISATELTHLGREVRTSMVVPGEPAAASSDTRGGSPFGDDAADDAWPTPCVA